MAPAGERDADGVEQRGLDEHLGGVLVTACGLATHDAGEGLHPGGVRDDTIIFCRGVVLAVQGAEGLAPPRPQRQVVAGHLADIEDVQRTAQIDGEEIGHVDQGIDRAKADRGEPVLKPGRAGTVLHVADYPAQHPRTGLRPFDPPMQGMREAGRYCGGGERLQRAEARGGEVACDATDRQRIPAIGGDRDIDDRIVEPCPRGVGDANRRVVRQLDDAGMVLAEAHFTRRQQHPGAFHAADLAYFQRDAGAWDVAVGWGEYRLHTGAGVRRAANHRKDTAAGIHLAGAQAIGVGVLHRLDHVGDAERRQNSAAVLDAFELQPDLRQGVRDFDQGGAGFQVRLQPGQREFHRSDPLVQRDGRERVEPVMAQPADIAFVERA